MSDFVRCDDEFEIVGDFIDPDKPYVLDLDKIDISNEYKLLGLTLKGEKN